MKLIKPSYTIMNQESGMSGLLKHIELCGRTAYKSESEIKEDSAIKFVEMLIKRGHGAVLEHGTVYLKLNVYHRETYFKYCHNDYSVAKSIGNADSTLNWAGSSQDKDFFYSKVNGVTLKERRWSGLVTTNYRVLVENGWLDDLQYQYEPTEHHEKRLSVKFICDRGVSHEFVRHRVFSFVQESTRYCNYSKDKFDAELTFIKPCWITKEESFFGNALECEKVNSFDFFPWEASNSGPGISTYSADIFLASCAYAEMMYLQLIKNGWVAQQARSVLPNSLKTELIMTGTVEQFKHFFELRSAITAHPQARELSIPLEEEFKRRGYI